MIKKYNELIKELSNDYANPKTKLQRMVRDGNYKYLGNAIYTDESDLPPYLFAGYLRSPSYISFEYALQAYGFIPEAVHVITCATTGARKSLDYELNNGMFWYRDVPKAVFSLGVKTYEYKGYSYSLATPEKAVCDQLYTIKPYRSVKMMQYLIYEDLRMEEEDMETLDIELLEKISEKYHCTNVKTFIKMLKNERKQLYGWYYF